MFGQLRRAALPELTALLLRGNPIGDEGVKAICLALRDARAMPKLKLLDLSGGNADYAGNEWALESPTASDRGSSSSRSSKHSGDTPGGGTHSGGGTTGGGTPGGGTPRSGGSKPGTPAAGGACKHEPVETKLLNGHGRARELADMLISDHGVQLIAQTMLSGCLNAMTRLYLHGQPRIGSAGLDALQSTLLDGACGKLLMLCIDGHQADHGTENATLRVLRARGIDSDLMPAFTRDARLSADDDLDEDEA